MPTYLVNVREVHICPTRIKADSMEDAITKVVMGEGDQSPNTEYSWTMGSDVWDVDEVTDD